MAANSDPLVTVLTPVYNGEDYLAECIEGVLNQTYKNFEYIIVNNCSTDRTLELAQRYAACDGRIRVCTNEKFVGVIENHNIAFRMMSPNAKYCKVVSADDFIFRDCIQKMVEFAEEHPTAGFVGAYQLSGNCVKWQGFQYPRQLFTGTEVCRRVLFQRQVFVNGQPVLGFGTPTSLLYRADLVRDSDCFYPNPSPHSDTSACFRYLDRCDFGFVYEILSFERTHEKTQSSKSIEMNRHASAYLDDLIKYGPSYLNPHELDQKIDGVLEAYHRFLAANLLESRDQEFWNYHKSRLKELGYPLSEWTLLKALLFVAMKEILNPERSITELWRRISPKFHRAKRERSIGEFTAVGVGRK
jgi:glycosyltransferase involved in cell wall biosynthesis